MNGSEPDLTQPMSVVTLGWAVTEAARVHPNPLFLAPRAVLEEVDPLRALPQLVDALDALKKRPATPRAQETKRRRRTR